VKTRNRVLFGEKLDVGKIFKDCKSVVVEDLSADEAGASAEKASTEAPHSRNRMEYRSVVSGAPCEYELSSVVVHKSQGDSVASGHYVSYVWHPPTMVVDESSKDPKARRPSHGRWRRHDDTRVHDVQGSITEAIEATGEEDPYLFFYTRRDRF